MGQDLADVVAAGAEGGKEGIAEGAVQRAARPAAIGFHVADLGLDGAAAAEVRDQPWRQAATGAADHHAGQGAPLLLREVAGIADPAFAKIVVLTPDAEACEELILLFLPALYAAWFRIKPTADALHEPSMKEPESQAAMAAE